MELKFHDTALILRSERMWLLEELVTEKVCLNSRLISTILQASASLGLRQGLSFVSP